MEMAAPLSVQEALICVAFCLGGIVYAASFQRWRAALALLIMLWLGLGLGARSLAGLTGVELAHNMIPVVSNWLPWNLIMLALLPRMTLISRAALAMVVFISLQQVIALLIDPERLAAMATLNQWLVGMLPQVLEPLVSPLEPRLMIVASLLLFIRWQKFGGVVELFLFLLSTLILLAYMKPEWTYACFLGGVALVLLGVLASSHQMAFVDPLTGLKNRRAMTAALGASGRNIAIGMLDIDHFKRINDRFGHDFGDHVLRMVASRVRQLRLCRAYRFGGEEFCLVFRGCTLPEAKHRCEQIREAISAQPIAMRSGRRPTRRPLRKSSYREKVPSVRVTASIGVAHTSKYDGDADATVTAADKALYRAKKNGRDQVVAAR